jgi:hypothetical protein
MREPTKVTSSTKATDNGSSSIPASSWNWPAGTHENRCNDRARSSAAYPRRLRNTRKPTRNAAHDIAVANRGPHESVRWPPISSTAAPRSGSATSSQPYAATPVAGCAAADAESASGMR